MAAARIDLTDFQSSVSIPIWFDVNDPKTINDLLPFLDLETDCLINHVIYPVTVTAGSTTVPNILEVRALWAPWDEDISTEYHVHFIIPEYDLYHRMVEAIGHNAIDMLPDFSPGEGRRQTWLRLHHLSMPDLLYHLSTLHGRVEMLETTVRDMRNRLGILTEFIASREPGLARQLGLTLTLEDMGLQPGHLG